jgi:flavodoxin
MARTLVAYLSVTGNTRKVAEAVFDALHGVKDLRPVDEAGTLEPYGLVFIGFPVQSHSVPYKAETFLKAIPAGLKVAVFATHGSLHGHRLSREALEYAVILASRARILGTYSCRGKLSLKALEILGRSPEHAEWAEMAPSAGTHPDGHDLEEARNFARLVQAKAGQAD